MIKLFGTDGVRGSANTHPMTAEMALRIGAAVGHYFRRDKDSAKRVVFGNDTRLSGYMFESALTAGLTSTGVNVLLLSPVPTPAVGLLTRFMRADLGVMISASHNPAANNGIKFFGPDGYKLSNKVEDEIETLVAEEIGRVKRIDDSRYRYIARVNSSFPRQMRLDGLKVVIDCAHGAAYHVAPMALWELGATVIPVGVAPNGFNINDACGSTQPQAAAKAVVARRADVGVCLDGDADRVILIDENGRIGDGDQFMALMTARWSSEKRLRGDVLVATVMSNLGLERFLNDRSVQLDARPSATET